MPNKLKREHYVVTGSSGYIGAALTKELLRQGFYVTLLTSSESALEDPRLRMIKWTLASDSRELGRLKFDDNFPKPTVIFHLAHSWINPEGSQDRNINLTGTLALYEWAKINSIKFIFTSSISAREDALNQYGKCKFLIEQSLASPDAVVARIGLIYGGIEASQWGLLCKIIGKTRILPMVDPWVRVQPIHLQEVVHALIIMAAINKFSKKVYTIASEEDISFGEFLQIISLQRFYRPLHILPVPSKTILFFLKLVPNKIVDLMVVKDRILGLVGIQKVLNNEDLEELNLKISRLRKTNSIHDFESEITREALFVMKGIFNNTPSLDSVEKYVFAIKTFHQGHPYRFPFWIIFPFFLKFIEPLPFVNANDEKAIDLLSRLNLALGILESGDAARMTYKYTKKSSNFLTALNTLILEFLIYPIRWFYWKVR